MSKRPPLRYSHDELKDILEKEFGVKQMVKNPELVRQAYHRMVELYGPLKAKAQLISLNKYRQRWGKIPCYIEGVTDVN